MLRKFLVANVIGHGYLRLKQKVDTSSSSAVLKYFPYPKLKHAKIKQRVT
jgi:hypothetical protein